MENYNKIKKSFKGKCTHCAEVELLEETAKKKLKVSLWLSNQLNKCMNECSAESRRYERAVLLGMLQAFRLTDDIEAGIENYYLQKILDMIDIESED